MKIVGIITEYNPFHNGHLYHIEQARAITGADAVIAVMSGNFVQRGTPAILPKHLRTEAALKAGASVVFELPVCYATGSAEFFAEGAISLLHKLGCVNAICFGSESGDINSLKRIAQILINEPSEYQNLFQAELKKGRSFPKARQNALNTYLNDDSLVSILEEPNNILGIEYIKALEKRKSNLEVYTIKRQDSHYHNPCLSDKYSSASAIRKLFQNEESDISGIFSDLNGQVPPSCYCLMEHHHGSRYPVYANDFSLLLKFKLLSESRNTLIQYMDVSEELANRIMNHRNEYINFEQFCDLLKSKELTYGRISRALIHILLDIKSDDMFAYAENGHCLYGHILGFRKDSASVLSEFKKSASVPVITKLSQTEGISELGLKMLEHDIFASDLYESVITDKYQTTFINEHSQSLVFV